MLVFTFITCVKCQQSSIYICSDDYKFNSYPLTCDSGFGVNILRVFQIFGKNGQSSPECQDQGTPYNYSKPFVDFCYGKARCEISPAFLDEKKLFEAETYFLTDKTLYLKPYRIDITYQCLSLSSFTTTTRTSTIRTTQVPLSSSIVPLSSTNLIPSSSSSPNLFLKNNNNNKNNDKIVDNNDSIEQTSTQITNTNTFLSSNQDQQNNLIELISNGANKYQQDRSKMNQLLINLSSTTTQLPFVFTSSAYIVQESEPDIIETTTTTIFSTSKEDLLTVPILNTKLISRSNTNETSTTRNMLRSNLFSLNFFPQEHHKQIDQITTTSIAETTRTNFYEDKPQKQENTNTATVDSILNETHFTELEILNNRPTIVYSDLNNIKFKYKSFKDSSFVSTTASPSVASNNNADRIVMIVLIVLGVVFFLIILAIIILICIRRRNQKKLDREFGYKTDKTSSQFTPRDNLNTSNLNTIDSKATGSIREKSFSTPFTEHSNSTPVINYENNSETNGTYRSKNNNAYDNSDNSLNLKKAAQPANFPRENSTGFSPLHRNQQRVDYDEYWRTNI